MPSSSARPTSSAGLQSITRKFIGAVEDEWQLYSDRASDYTLGSIIGFGSSSTVYTALYHPPTEPNAPKPEPTPCALKVLDLDSLAPHSLSLLQRETTLMSLSKHPNVIRVRGSWIDGHKLYIAMRLMNKGSAADIMRYGWPGGMEEEVVKCILRQALQGLNYLHINGFIHRDIKAANLLIDDDGTVLLGDLGVAADLAEESSFSPHSNPAGSKQRNITTASAALASIHANEQHSAGKRVVLIDPPVPQRPKIGKRKSFVGTPCWMAPELIQGRQYDASADIWSFGITALELTQGRPPRSRESPQKVLVKIIQEEPPSLDREGGTFKYSRAFKEIVDSCLIKDPSKRPTAEQLLQSPFFKSAKKPSYLVGAILKDLPPLAQRQERRPLPSAHTHHTVESWDFATTIHTPTASVYRRRFLDESEYPYRLGSDEDVSEPVLEQHDSHSSIPGRRHSRAVSWHDDPALVEEDPLEDVESPASASSSPSDRIFAESEVPMNSDASTSPSSISLQEAKPSHNGKDSLNPSSTAVPIPIPTRSSLRPPVSESQPSTSPQPDLSTSPSSSSGLWRKLKNATNYRRPSTRGGPELSVASEKERDGGDLDPSPDDVKEKVGLGSRFAKKASAGKNALAGATARTAQAVGLMKS